MEESEGPRADWGGFWARRSRALLIAGKWAAFACVWVILGTLITGGRNLDRYRLLLGPLLVWYLVNAVVVSVLVGLLSPWAVSRIRGAVIGAVAAMIAALSLYAFATPLEIPFRIMVFGALASAPVGGAIGAIHWAPPRSEERSLRGS